MWMRLCTGSARTEDFRDFWKSQLVELSPASGEDGWLSVAHEALWRVWHEMEGGQMEKPE